jgi:hypothetical protein
MCSVAAVSISPRKMLEQNLNYLCPLIQRNIVLEKITLARMVEHSLHFTKKILIVFKGGVGVDESRP